MDERLARVRLVVHGRGLNASDARTRVHTQGQWSATSTRSVCRNESIALTVRPERKQASASNGFNSGSDDDDDDDVAAHRALARLEFARPLLTLFHSRSTTAEEVRVAVSFGLSANYFLSSFILLLLLLLLHRFCRRRCR